MARKLFISYRRDDSKHAVQAIATQLGARFGPSRVFMDLRSIGPGESWPKRLAEAVTSSVVVLAVMGPRWLKSQDQYGIRRLDLDHDWVRQELALALKENLPVIPIFLEGFGQPPPAEALPPPLKELFSHNSFQVHEDAWPEDVNRLAKHLISKFGFEDNEKSPEQPGERLVDMPALADEKLDQQLAQLAGWEHVERTLPDDYPNTRHEIRKRYTFPSFAQAIFFMSEAVPICEHFQPYPHHPRWENVWNSVTVWLSTWDSAHVITEMDIRLAVDLDKLRDASDEKWQRAQRSHQRSRVPRA